MAEVDECMDGSANCDFDAICEDLPDGYECFCRVGFTGSGTVGDCNG